MITATSPASGRASHVGIRMGRFAPAHSARYGNHSLAGAGSSSTMLNTPVLFAPRPGPWLSPRRPDAPTTMAGAFPDDRELPLADGLDNIVDGTRPVEPAVSQSRRHHGLDDHILDMADRRHPRLLRHRPGHRVQRVLFGFYPAAFANAVPAGVALRHEVWYAGRLGRGQQVIGPLDPKPLVAANHRSKCFISGLPARATEMAVIWWTMVSGWAAATASPTDAASRPSITMASAPCCSSLASLSRLVVVAVTWCPGPPADAPVAVREPRSHQPRTLACLSPFLICQSVSRTETIWPCRL